MRPKSLSAIAAAFAMLAVSGPAWASNYDGMLALFFTFYLGLPWSALHLVAFAFLALFDRYRSRKLAVWHSGIAAIGPMAGLLATLIDHRDSVLLWVLIGANMLLLALALLPMGMHAIHRRGAARRAAAASASAPP
jgi:uncharacterized membrane protein